MKMECGHERILPFRKQWVSIRRIILLCLQQQQQHQREKERVTLQFYYNIMLTLYLKLVQQVLGFFYRKCFHRKVEIRTHTHTLVVGLDFRKAANFRELKLWKYNELWFN